jgi:uncharacterized phiE125 gp8 family phage protein
MPLLTLIAPAAMPIDVAEARQHVRQDITDEDSRLRRSIMACTAWAQTETQRTFVAARLRMVFDAFPGPSLTGVPGGVAYSVPAHALLLERGPVLRVISVTYLDMSGVRQTMPETDYQLDNSMLPARITPKFGRIWPVSLPQIGAIEVTYDAGMAAPITADATSNTLAVRGPWLSYAAGDVLRLSNSGGALPAPLAEMTDYIVESVVSPGIYRLTTALGGTAIDITSSGTGTHFVGEVPSNVVAWMLLRVGSMFEHREAEVGAISVAPLAYIDRLLDESRVILY